MKNKLKLVSFVLLAFLLIGCGDQSSENSEEDASSEPISLAISPGPYSDLFIDYVQPILEEEGFTVETTSFSELQQGNESLLEHTSNVNVEQHLLYLENFNEERDADLVTLGDVPTLPTSLYTSRKKSLDDVEEGDKIGVPQDVSNLTRALLILEKAGWISLDESVEPIDITSKDIVDNPHQLEIIEMDSSTIPRTREDLDYAVIPGSIAYDSGVSPEDSLLEEDVLPELMLQLVVPSGYEETEGAKRIREIYDSEEFKNQVNQDELQWIIPE